MKTISTDDVRLTDLRRFFKLIQEFYSSPKELALVTDYDGTLTSMDQIDGQHCTTFDLLSRRAGFSDAKTNGDRESIEEDVRNGTIKATSWDQAFESFERHGLTKSTLDTLFHQDSPYRICARHGYRDLFAAAEECHVQVYIVSGGLSDVIRQHLEMELGYFPGNIRIVSTSLGFCNRQFTGPIPPVVTSLNKQEVMKSLGIFDDIAGKKLVVVGDYIHDAMPLLPSSPILRIGISEGNKALQAADLLEHFDAVTIRNSLPYVAEVIRALS